MLKSFRKIATAGLIALLITPAIHSAEVIGHSNDNTGGQATGGSILFLAQPVAPPAHLSAHLWAPGSVVQPSNRRASVVIAIQSKLNREKPMHFAALTANLNWAIR